ncbi:MAG: hypothetical protein CO030_00780 [Candidatus Magasanikbacteria bacterium CG_4_9_14_0_2_um_filter_42_11]|uniref:Ribbon-helix-helix protein CopG domain-containing protein n=1 Tax=Candidatus Magasanikbacteria bacterium CG_4_9_14_0_2_um_filter_42_11 TaxID=1974643 RepID=A0A2M8FAV2_9BACT|nr:MAG: hypothetical protein COU34_00705 [Candidatus Magasanikbacteria bacterium CG10_big_fil_rev_8_21_14_0_10_43_9]PIY92699.1 MAG: hypothetical protein COY70_01865 [Candidatus Magasanikbacteria bacterium CG_4_10_14_0_8_um_filter_42_12]PJC52838.1 MAG: hypothetical protein CO030_00780 [Candidatus Magasanikbacteria bacterium CG_4_9_14_0_2_um_filter_42_11]
MATLSVPLSAELMKKIDQLLESGVGANKADVARKAIEFFAEEQAIREVLQAEQELAMGNGLSGDLDELAARL